MTYRLPQIVSPIFANQAPRHQTLHFANLSVHIMVPFSTSFLHLALRRLAFRKIHLFPGNSSPLTRCFTSYRSLGSTAIRSLGGNMLVVQAIMRLFEVHSRRFETILQPRNAALAYFRSESASPEIDEPESPPIKNSPGNFEFVSACDSELREKILQDFIVVDDFLSEAEERSLLEEAEAQIARVHYENEENWDNAIIGYRETEKKNWNSENKKIMKRVRELAFPPGVSQLVNVHILDLAKDGYIKPHVDSVRFCGDTIAGLSLLSPSVLRLVQEAQKDPVIDVLLKRRSLYIMKGIARYNYTHEILRESQSVFKGEVVERDRRISLMFRNEPSEDDE